MTEETPPKPPLPKKSKALKVVATLFTLLALLLLGGSIAAYQLGKVDPADTATAKLAWGDRLERRLDAIIDKKRPPVADRIEARLEAFTKRIGWN